MLHVNCRCLLLLAAGGILLLAQGGEAMPVAPTGRHYQAQWIWGHVESPQPFQFVRFRKTIELVSRPARVTAYIAAVGRTSLPQAALGIAPLAPPVG